MPEAPPAIPAPPEAAPARGGGGAPPPIPPPEYIFINAASASCCCLAAIIAFNSGEKPWLKAERSLRNAIYAPGIGGTPKNIGATVPTSLPMPDHGLLAASI